MPSAISVEARSSECDGEDPGRIGQVRVDGEAFGRHRPGARDGGRQASAGSLDQARGRGQAGQVGAAAAGLVPDPVQVRADRVDADEQLGGDLRVGAAPRDQDDQLPLPGAQLPQAQRRSRRVRGSEQGGAYSAVVLRLIAAPRSSALRARAVPSACRPCAAVPVGGARTTADPRIPRAN